MNVDDSGIIGGLIAAVLVLINTGAVVRFILMLIHITYSEDEKGAYKKKMKNLILFLILANCITGIVATILSYIS